MKSKFVKKLLSFMSCVMAVCGLFCFTSCASESDSGSSGGNTDKLVLDFNGGKMFNYKSAEFLIEEITPYVGMPIDNALAALGIAKANIKKEGFYLHGWTLKKNGETCVTNLPTFGTLYAKWGTDPLPKDEDVPLNLTLDFNGGKLDGASFKYFDNSKVAKYADKTIDEALEGLGITTITKENYELVGWTDNLTTANEVTTLPTKGNVTLYAIWQFNGTANPLTLTLDFNGGTSGEESYFVLTDDLIADYKGMLIATYFTEKNKPLPTKEGYTLIGWSTTRNGEATIVNIPLEGTVKYYAVWEEVVPEKLTFTLDAGKGLIALDAYNEDSEKVKTISTEFEAGATLEEVLLSLPSFVPVFESLPDNDDVYCYEENGVYYYPYAYGDKNDIEIKYNAEIPDITLTKDTTFYIEYRKCVDVLFNLNGGYRELKEEKSSENFTMSMGFYSSMLWSNIKDNLKIKRDGYVLEGFTYTKDGSDFATEIPLDDCTLYAKWAEPKECTLTLKSEPYSTFIDKNGKSLGSELKITYTTGSTLEQILEQINMDYSACVDEAELKFKSFVEFVGFVAESDIYEEDTILTKDLTLSVKTQPVILEIYFNYNGGKNNSNNGHYIVIFGEDIQNKISKQSIASIIEEYNVPTPTKEGYKLVGWGYDTETPIDVIDETVEELLSGEADLDLYAVWQEKDEPTNPEPEKLTYTWDAGEGFFYDYVKDEFIKTISVEFDAGATVDEIYELLIEEHSDHINPMYCFEEDGIEYSYKDDGIYYIVEEIKDNKDNVIMNVWTNTGTGMSSNQKVYEDITYYFSYVKLVKITYKLEGGYVIEYDHESDKEIKITEDIKGFGVEGYKEFSVNDPERDGYVFMGWTRTKDGDDFVTKVPSEEITVYAKWELPKECTLTINAGEYSQLFDADGNSLGKEIKITFISGKTISDVLVENNIKPHAIVNKFEIEDAYYHGFFEDAEGKEYDKYILTNSITLYPKPTWLGEYDNVGILKYYDYDNDGFYDEKAEPEYVQTYDKETFKDRLYYTPSLDGYIFLGWTYTPNGNDYVDLDDNIPARVTTTVYAKWIPESEVKPLYEYSSDNSQITFTFVPSYFGYDWDSDEFHEVQLLSDATTWAQDERYFMTKDEDGIYTITFDYVNSVYLGFKNWPGFKFLVIEEDIMLGPNEYKISLSNDKIIGPEDSPHFKMEFISSLLTLDLNGGSVNGKTDDILLDSDDIYNRLLVDCFENPIKDGYVFAGWTSTRDEEDYVTYVPAGIDVLYAKWVEPTSGVVTLIARENEVFYDYKGQPLENELSFDFEAGITLGDLLNQYNIDYSNMVYPYENNNEAFVFAEFVDGNGNQYDSTKILTASVTLYPTYHSRAIVNFDLNGGYIDNSQGVRVEGTWTNYVPYGIWFDQWVDGIPQKEGYNFVGWSTSGYADELVTQVTSSCSVCAIWQDPLELFINGDIVGTLTIDETGKFEDGHSLKYEGNGIYTYSFTFDSINMVGWDAPSNGIAFKLRPVKESWAISYGIIYQGEHPVIGGGEVVTTAVGGAPNIIVGGLKDGNSYIITVRCTEDGDVFVKIDEA